jgi:hypothetical protein
MIGESVSASATMLSDSMVPARAPRRAAARFERSCLFGAEQRAAA